MRHGSERVGRCRASTLRARRDRPWRAWRLGGSRKKRYDVRSNTYSGICNNAAFAFREDAIGSLQKGKYADLLVLDRDYLTIPADQIKDIQPVLTMIGGKVVWDASAR